MRPPKPCVQFTRSGPRIDAGPAYVRALRRQFESRHWVYLPQMVEPSLLKALHKVLAAARFKDRKDGRIAREALMSQNIAYNLLRFLADDPNWMRFVERITGCKGLELFDGRVFRFDPNGTHFDSWHGDAGDKRLPRMVAMSVNLSAAPYRGGVLEFRRKDTQRIFDRIHNVRPGGAVFFRISPLLQHRVTPLEGRASRTVFAGWYVSGAKVRANFLLRSEGQEAPLRPRAPRSPGRLSAGMLRIRAGHAAAIRETSSGALLLDARTRVCYRLDGVGKRLWQLMVSGAMSLEQASRTMAQEYEAGAEQLEKDGRALIHGLFERDLAEISEGKE